MEVAVPLCAKLGLPVAPHKVVGPSTSLVFLGIEIDSLRQEIRLPEDKLSRLKQALCQWGDKRAATKRELQSLIGHLNHAAKVVRPGRPFLRGLIDTMKIPRRQHHKVRLSVACRGDVVWWQRLLASWNGVAFFPFRAHLFSDASGLWGCGAFIASPGEWFQILWPPSWSGVSIALKELVPIVVALAVWGHRWSRGSLLCHCDNEAVVHSVARRPSPEPLASPARHSAGQVGGIRGCRAPAGCAEWCG